MLYPTASEDPCEELLPWEPQDDLEFDDDFVLSKQPRSLVADVMTSAAQESSKLKFTKQGVPCDDSDSDLEDFHHILDQSEFTLKLSDQSLRKKRKNPMGTGLHPNPAKYDEIIVTYETNKRCLESICQHLNSDDVTEQDLLRVKGLMNQWEKLHNLALERHKQAKFFHSVNEVMFGAQAVIREAESCLPYDRFSSAEQLKQLVCFLEEKLRVLGQQGNQLEEVKQQLKEFSVQYPTVYVDKYMQELTSLHKSSTTMANKVSEHLKHLGDNQAAWLEFLARQQELDAFLVTDRERLHKLLCQQEFGVRVTKKDVLKELETLQENLSLYESRLSALQSMWASLTKTSDHAAQQQLLASVADLRNQLFVVSERCREIYYDMEDDETIPLDQQTDLNQLAVTAAALVFKNPKSQKSSTASCPAASHVGTGITRSCASWLRSLPVQVVALMLVTGLVCALDPDILKRLTNFSLTISPELCYVNGPPTI
ncbi:unnamed protein product [Candidula unifasciata]|uniref:KASH domain-containing protein n=1 Tax=Candidula unifasciata TaxID=100452 RepID=A0A8S3YRL4_9EUPU|nr:unnamed protein product [Candidula unifasciata]